MMDELQGFCDDGFAPIAQAFAANFDSAGEAGAAVAVAWQGRLVVDLCAGFADRDGTRRWQPGTLVNVFSAGKGMLALVVLSLVERGLVKLDAPVARYWPEYAAAGKAATTVEQLLCHRAGLPAVPPSVDPEAVFDFDAMAQALAAAAPLWPPGERQAYHAFTFGWLVGEVIRRVSGASPGDYLRSLLAPLPGATFHFGVPDDDLVQVADLGTLETAAGGGGAPGELAEAVFGYPDTLLRGTNSRRWRQAEIPAANGHTDAATLATVYGALANGGNWGDVRLLGEQVLAECLRTCSAERDAVLQLPVHFSTGFMLGDYRTAQRFVAGGRCFGHPGRGGSIAFADPDRRLSFAYVTNRLGGGTLRDRRATALIEALYKRCNPTELA